MKACGSVLIILLESGASQIAVSSADGMFFSLSLFFFRARGEQTQPSPGLWLSLAERVGAAKRLYLIVVWNINHPIPACPSPTRPLASRINKTAEYQRAASPRSLINPGSRDEISPVKLLDVARGSGCKGRAEGLQVPLRESYEATDCSSAGGRGAIFNY